MHVWRAGAETKRDSPWLAALCWYVSLSLLLVSLLGWLVPPFPQACSLAPLSIEEQAGFEMVTKRSVVDECVLR